MQKSLVVGLLSLALLAFSCSPPTGNPSTSFSYDETALNKVLLDASQAKGVTYAQFDGVIVPPSQRSVVAIDRLGKYLFGDEYVADITAYGGSPVVDPSTMTNTWSPQNTLSETVNQVTGFTNDLVRAIFKVNDLADPHHGRYHVYRYIPWVSSLSGVTLNVWFGVGHVIYFNPVKGQVVAGQPYMELFPVTSPSLSTEVDEVRIESTSYFKFRSLTAGDGNTDMGSTLAKMETGLGAPTSTVPLNSMSEMTSLNHWGDRNILFTYPISGTFTGAYIHYDLGNDVKVRIFLGGTASDLHISSMYFVRTTTP